MAKGMSEAEAVMRRLAKEEALPSEEAVRSLRSDLLELAQWWRYEPPATVRAYWREQAEVVMLRLLNGSFDEALAPFVAESGLIGHLEQALLGDDAACRAWSKYATALFIWHRLLLKEEQACTQNC